MHIRYIGLMLSTLALALAVACGGGDDKGSSPLSGGSGTTWDVSKADDLAHAALIVAGDLPSSGWSTTDDDFGQADKPMAAGCSDFEGFKKDAKSVQVARAKRQLEKAGAARNDFGTQVESTVTVFKDNKTASDLANRYKGVVNSDKFISCFEAEIRNDTSRDAKIVIKKGATNASAPNGGTSTGLDVDVSLGSDSLVAHTENHVWVSGNAIIQVNITAAKANFDAGVIKTAVAKQEQAANDALKGTRQRSAAATATPSRSNPTPTPSRPSGTPTPTRGATGNLSKLGALGDTSSHRYMVRIESSGVDFFGMEDVIATVQSAVGGAAPRAGAPLVVEMTGAYSKPDKGQVKIAVSNSNLTVTTIGTQQWRQVGTGAATARTVGRQSVNDLSLAVSILASVGEDDAVLRLLNCAGNETINGVAARKCGFVASDLSRTDLQQFIDGFVGQSNASVTIRGADVTKATFQIWASQQGDYPVRFLFEFAGKDSKGTSFNALIDANVSDINRPIDIAAPR